MAEVKVHHSTGGLRLDERVVWDTQAAIEMVDEALIPSIEWQTDRGRGVDGKKFKPYSQSYIRRMKKRTKKAQKVTLRKTGRMRTIIDEGTGEEGGLVRFVNKYSAGLGLRFNRPGYEGYLYAWSQRRFLGWNRRGLKLAKTVIERTLNRLMPVNEPDPTPWPAAPGAGAERAA